MAQLHRADVTAPVWACRSHRFAFPEFPGTLLVSLMISDLGAGRLPCAFHTCTSRLSTAGTCQTSSSSTEEGEPGLGGRALLQVQSVQQAGEGGVYSPLMGLGEPHVSMLVRTSRVLWRLSILLLSCGALQQ